SMSSRQRWKGDPCQSDGGSDKPMPWRSNMSKRPSEARPSISRTPMRSSNTASIGIVPPVTSTTSCVPPASAVMTRDAMCASSARAYWTSLVRERRSLPTSGDTGLAAELRRRGEERLEDVVELDRLAEREDPVAEQVGLHEALDPIVRERSRLIASERRRCRHARVGLRVEVRARAVLPVL